MDIMTRLATDLCGKTAKPGSNEIVSCGMTFVEILNKEGTYNTVKLLSDACSDHPWLCCGGSLRNLILGKFDMAFLSVVTQKKSDSIHARIKQTYKGLHDITMGCHYWSGK